MTCFLRECLILPIFGHWCRWVTALGSLIVDYWTLVQIAYCVRVSGCLFGKHLPVNSLAFVVVFALADHICRVFFRLLEGLVGLALQTWVIHRAFGGFGVVWRSKCGETLAL